MSHESVPLLPPTLQRTPLPKGQIFVLLSIQLAEPMTAMVIFPFIMKLVGELPITNGQEELVGYYAGLIESLFFVTEALTVLQWSRLSDRVGRKPVILFGLFGLTISMISFGLSRSYWSLVGSRCLAGFLNGNVGVIKSMIGEVSDSTNIAQAMALLPVVWTSGATIGSILGGTLANPYEQYPRIFGRFEFWRNYPYALPCFVVAGYTTAAFLLGYFYLDESLKHKNSTSPESDVTSNAPTQLPLSQILTPRILISIINYALIALLDICIRAVQPLFYTSSIELGGLAFTPFVVGFCLAAFNVTSGIYQAFAFSPIYDRFGPKRIFITSMAAFIPIFILYPLMNISARVGGGVNSVTWGLHTLQIVLYIIMDMGFSCAILYIRTAAPEGALGATNGLAQTSISIVRAVGPAASSSLYAVTMQYNLIDGWLVYIVLILLSFVGLGASFRLPKTLWTA